MKLLFLDSPAFAKQDMLDAFTDCGLSYDLSMRDTMTEKIMLLTLPLIRQ